jgi:DNA/RNA endonuclease G, NUC1
MKSWLLIIVLALAGLFNSYATSYLPVPAKDLVRHKYYTLSYNEKYEQANWVYYVLTDSMVIAGGQERTNKFKVDELVPTGSAKSSDYTKSGYDRGHLCPAADMDFNRVAMEESFFMSNVSPQAPDFNRGIWKDLEIQVRDWAKQKHKLYVVTGPVFSDNKGTIGQDNVLVPGYFYKVLYDDTTHPEIIAFVLPNRKSDRPLSDFAVSVDELERITGFDFFSELPDNIENKIESKVELAGWFAGVKAPEQATAQINSNANPGKEANSNYNFYLILILVLFVVVILISLRGIGKRKR